MIDKLTTIPWGIHTIFDMIAPPGAYNEMPDGRWVRAVPVPYPPLLAERLRAAWWVFTGKAHAIEWPAAGDLEIALSERATLQSKSP